MACSTVKDTQGGPRSRRQLASKKKKALGMSERAKYVRELFVSGTGARRRGQQISADLVQVREKISIDERKRDAAARLCSVWLRHHVFRGGITLDLVTTRVPQRGDTVSDSDTCHLRTTPKKLWNCASRARQSQHWWNRVPVAGKQNWHQSWSHP